MQWFRLYSEFAHDPKIQILSESLQRRYVMLLCLHCNGSYEKRPDDEIALSLRVTRDIWIETRDELVTRGLLSHKDYKIIGWEKRQYISDIIDPTAAERQRRYRHRKRNATVTSRLPEQNRTDTDTEKEYKNSVKEKLILPEWLTTVTGESWNNWLEVRTRKKAPNTDSALRLAIRKLEKLKNQGYDPINVLDQSTERGWTGLFPIQIDFSQNKIKNRYSEKKTGVITL